MEKINVMVDPKIFDGDPISGQEASSTAAVIDKNYYDFEKYVSKTRILTYHYQISELTRAKPGSILEIGIGSKVVASVLKGLSLPVTTIDINPELKPDIVGSVTDLKSVVAPKSYDWILCARVLHHLSFVDFEIALKELASISKTGVVLTLPIEDLRIYFSIRRTAAQYKTKSLPLPLFLKKLAYKIFNKSEQRYRFLWKINSHSDTSMDNIENIISKYFVISKKYSIPEDRSHFVFILKTM